MHNQLRKRCAGLMMGVKIYTDCATATVHSSSLEALFWNRQRHVQEPLVALFLDCNRARFRTSVDSQPAPPAASCVSTLLGCGVYWGGAELLAAGAEPRAAQGAVAVGDVVLA